jgi:hypothetical protein
MLLKFTAAAALLTLIGFGLASAGFTPGLFVLPALLSVAVFVAGGKLAVRTVLARAPRVVQVILLGLVTLFGLPILFVVLSYITLEFLWGRGL